MRAQRSPRRDSALIIQVASVSQTGGHIKDERYISFSFLPELLHLELEKIGLRTAHSRRFFTVAFVKCFTAFVKSLDCSLALGLVVAIAGKTVLLYLGQYFLSILYSRVWSEYFELHTACVSDHNGHLTSLTLELTARG